MEFESGKMTVALDLAQYDNNDTVIRYAQMDTNGTDTVRTVSDPWKPTTEAEVKNFEETPCEPKDALRRSLGFVQDR